MALFFVCESTQMLWFSQCDEIFMLEVNNTLNYEVTNCNVQTITEVIKFNWEDNEQKLRKNMEA
jgi:hypothetical protein